MRGDREAEAGSWGCGHFRAGRNLVTRGGWDGEGGGKLGGCLLEGGSLKKKNQGGLTEVGAGEESLFIYLFFKRHVFLFFFF